MTYSKAKNIDLSSFAAIITQPIMSQTV